VAQGTQRSKVVTVVGARPQFIKAAAVTRAIAEHASFEEVMVHTGQHFDENMSGIFFSELQIPEPAYNLGVHGGTHGVMTGRMLERIERILLEEMPEILLIYGDTNSTLAGALAAAKLHIPLAHVESGLRSFNRRMPEEVNRIVADRLSDLLFCPTRDAIKNLEAEGILTGVEHVGDVMFDAAVFARSAAESNKDLLRRLGLQKAGYKVCTIHRAENTDSETQLRRVITYLQANAGDMPMVFPVHPRTRACLKKHAIDTTGLQIVEPLGYVDFALLVANSVEMFTDSGGVQKEAYFHGVPCVTIRSETEWVETVEAGWNRLWTESRFREPRRPIDDYGTGDAAVRIVESLNRFLLGA